MHVPIRKKKLDLKTRISINFSQAKRFMILGVTYNHDKNNIPTHDVIRDKTIK